MRDPRFKKRQTEEDAIFTLNHLFDAIEETRETRAEVRKVEIVVEDMVRLRGCVTYKLTIETDMEIHESEEWNALLESYYPKGRVKTEETTMKELRELFDEDMLEFFEEYKPTLLYNGEKLDIQTFLTGDEVIYFGENSDT